LAIIILVLPVVDAFHASGDDTSERIALREEVEEGGAVRANQQQSRLHQPASPSRSAISALIVDPLKPKSSRRGRGAGGGEDSDDACREKPVPLNSHHFDDAIDFEDIDKGATPEEGAMPVSRERIHQTTAPTKSKREEEHGDMQEKGLVKSLRSYPPAVFFMLGNEFCERFSVVPTVVGARTVRTVVCSV
jgi:hypothetical protein